MEDEESNIKSLKFFVTDGFIYRSECNISFLQ